MKKYPGVAILLFFVINLLICNSSLSYALNNNQYNVAIVVYDDVYLLDFCGPLEIFNDTMINDSLRAFNVYLVSSSKDRIKSHTETDFFSNYNLSNCPTPDIIVVPGGDLKLAQKDNELSKWIVEASKSAKILMSVCTGAFILADLGLLDGCDATTWYGATNRLQKLYPKINVKTGIRFTDNGKIITTAGVSAGIDGALHVVEKLFGKEIATKTAQYIEWEYYLNK